MPMASTTQAAASIGSDCGDAEQQQRPAANNRLEAASTPLPPPGVDRAADRGPSTAEMMSEAEKMPKIQLVDRPRSRAMSIRQDRRQVVARRPGERLRRAQDDDR